MKKLLLIITASLLVTSCARDSSYPKFDHVELCSPLTGQAYLVGDGTGDTTFVRIAPQFDPMCKTCSN